jgi:hypothetical protein
VKGEKREKRRNEKKSSPHHLLRTQSWCSLSVLTCDFAVVRVVVLSLPEPRVYAQPPQQHVVAKLKVELTLLSAAVAVDSSFQGRKEVTEKLAL